MVETKELSIPIYNSHTMEQMEDPKFHKKAKHIDVR